jgi:hypothetical protein
MYQSRAGEAPLGDVLDLDLPAEDVKRLAQVDALLRVVAARDRDDAIAVDGFRAAALTRIGPGSVRSRAKW